MTLDAPGGAPTMTIRIWPRLTMWGYALELPPDPEDPEDDGKFSGGAKSTDSLADAVARYIHVYAPRLREAGEQTEEGEVDPVAEALKGVADAMRALGKADAATPMGAIEMLAAEVKTAGVELQALSEIATVLREVSASLDDLAQAVKGSRR